MIIERSGGGDGQARVVDTMFTSRNAREATCAVFDKLREGAPFRIAPTALFDARGILVKCIETSFSRTRREKFAGTSCRIVRKRREATNLLSLLASWEARAKRDDLLEDRVCIEATQDRPVCLDSASFRQWIRRRAWQEAEVRADTYDPLQQGYIAGPFFAQAFVLSDDGNQYDVEFRRKARSNEPHVSYRACRRIAAMSIAKAREGKSNASSFSDSEKRKTNADILELADDDDLFPAIDSSTETALRNYVNAIVEYLEETYEISVHALSVSFIRGAMHRELILLHVASVAWDSPPRDERLESKQSSVHRRVSHRAEQESKSPETITSSLRGDQTEQKVKAQPQVQRSRPASAAPALSTEKGRYAETKVAAVSRELSRLRRKVAQLEARAEDDAAKLLGSDKALVMAQAALQSAHKESRARESELRASLARQQSELNSIVAELARARSQLELERKLRSKAEVDAQNAKHALTSLEVHREFVRKSEG